MTSEQRKRIPFSEAPDYPNYEQAESFAEDFRTGAENAFEKGERWARYWLLATIDILTTLLRANIYSVVAYPPAGFVIDDTDYIEKAERFRGWILGYHPRDKSWTLLVSSQEVGTDEFKRLRRQYKEG